MFALFLKLYICAPVKNLHQKIPRHLRRRHTLRLSTWNVRTMCPGLSDDLSNMEDTRKTAVIDLELQRLNIDIAALQETRLAENGSLREANYTFFWQGKNADERHEHGVGFAVRNTLLPMTLPPTEGNDRVLALSIQTSHGPAHILSVYAPTLYSSDETKDRFYEDLDLVLNKIPASDYLFVLGDFNARVGADHSSWTDSIGHFGIGNMNENGQRVLEMCTQHKLCVTNTYFQTRPMHRVSWRHPRSKHWHQLDLVITRRADLNCVKITRTYHSADCDTDHSLVLTRVELKPKKIHHVRHKPLTRINAYVTTADPEKTDEFRHGLDHNLSSCDHSSATESWECLRKVIYEQALDAYGGRVRKNADWFEAHIKEMTPLIAAKRTALSKFKAMPSAVNAEALRGAKRKVKCAARRYANEYWLAFSSAIQYNSMTGDIKSMYEGIKKAIGPQVKKTAPLRSKTGEIITERTKQLDRWVEHYTDLYSTKNRVTDAALHAVQDLPIMEALDQQPTLGELSEAIDSLACGKAPGEDGITPDVMKLGKSSILPHLHDLLCLCWEEGSVPQTMRDAKIVTLFKNKGDRSDCNNYRGISLLAIVGKVFARVALSRLQCLAERVYPESQCGFRSARSTVDMIFTLRQLQEKCREQQKPLYLAFVDLTKAFDYVSRDGLFKILRKIGCPPKLLSILVSFHDNMHGTVCYEGASSERFPITSGVKQGCVLAPTLFGIFFSILLSSAFDASTDGIYIRTRADADLFKLSHLRAKTKVTSVLLREMLFADDAAIASHTEEGLQRLIDSLSRACKEFGVTISIKKTEVLCQMTPNEPVITIDGKTLSNVKSFKYLGSTITSNASLDAELDTRIAKAAAVMTKLSKRVWNNKKLTLHTKLQVYNSCVVSILTYASETWTLYARQERRINNFHLRCLRRILGISWEQHLPDTEVLKQANTLSMFAILRQRRLRWLGHVHRMAPSRLPRSILYGELQAGERPVGRPRLRYKDVCKKDLQLTGIGVKEWASLAMEREAWRHLVSGGVKEAESKRVSLAKEKRRRRKEGQQLASGFVCPICSRDCHARIGLMSHYRKCASRDHQ